MNIKTRLTRCCGKPVGGYKCDDGIRCPDCFDKLQGWREIEALQNALKAIREEIKSVCGDWREVSCAIDDIARAALKGND